MELSQEALTAIDLLHKNGYEGYAVGGCVRDSILGITPEDYDLTTNALPEETKAVFSGYRIIETGIKHGTVTVLVNNTPIEITTYRNDHDYKDHRHPENVTFSSNIEDDLSRRDFTVNAIAYSPFYGYKDPFGGHSDINSRLIRCVGDPETRFEEDALRILRGLRFSSQFSFLIEEKTAAAIHYKCELLNSISMERINAELSRFLTGDNVLSLLSEFKDVISVPIPELKAAFDFSQNNPHHNSDVYQHTIKTVSYTPPKIHLRWAALLHDIGKPETYTEENGVGHFYGHAEKSYEISKSILHRLKFDNYRSDMILTLIRHHDIPLPENEKTVKRYLNRFGEQVLRDLLDLKRADNLAQSPAYIFRQNDISYSEELINSVIASSDCFSLKDLAVNGNDLADLGYSGPEIGALLKNLLSLVIDGKIKNDRNILLSSVKSPK